MQNELNKQYGALLANLPVISIGLLLMFFALLMSPFPPDYVGAPFGETVSHMDRLQGNDVPAEVENVERPPRYTLRRLIDGMMYIAIIQGILAIVGIGILAERNLYLLLIVTGFFGVVYSAFLGLVFGPILLGTGSAIVLWGSTLAWATSRPLEIQLPAAKKVQPAPDLFADQIADDQAINYEEVEQEVKVDDYGTHSISPS